MAQGWCLKKAGDVYTDIHHFYYSFNSSLGLKFSKEKIGKVLKWI